VQNALLYSIWTIFMKFTPLGLWSFYRAYLLCWISFEFHQGCSCCNHTCSALCAHPHVSFKAAVTLQVFFGIQELSTFIFLLLQPPFALWLLNGLLSRSALVSIFSTTRVPLYWAVLNDHCSHTASAAWIVTCVTSASWDRSHRRAYLALSHC
jgi:hypothetical protein